MRQLQDRGVVRSGGPQPAPHHAVAHLAQVSAVDGTAPPVPPLAVATRTPAPTAVPRPVPGEQRQEHLFVLADTR